MTTNSYARITWGKFGTPGGGVCYTPINKDITTFSDNRVICTPEQCPPNADKQNLPPICGGSKFPALPPKPQPKCPELNNINDDKKKKIPIVLLPGIAGTRLSFDVYDGKTLAGRGEVWPSLLPGSNPLRGMELEKDGRTEVHHRDYIKEVLREWPTNFYGGILKFLKGLGYKEGKDLFTFPYDFRLDNAQHFRELDKTINDALGKSKGGEDDNNNLKPVDVNCNNKADSIKSSQGKKSQEEDEHKPQGQVILIGHSMGGLISRGYVLSSEESAKKVRAVITLSTPYWGAVKGYYAIINGYNFGNPIADPNMLKTVAQNAPAPYELLPRKPFITDNTKGTELSLSDSFRQVRYPKSGGDIGFNEWSMNPTVLDIADSYYSKLGTPTSPVPFPVDSYQIAGVGVCTLGGYTASDYHAPAPVTVTKRATGEINSVTFPRHPMYLYDIELNGRHVTLSPVFIDGDGTVPIWSLRLGDTSQKTWFIKKPTGGSTEHADVPGNKRVQQIVGQIVTAINDGKQTPKPEGGEDPANYKPMKPIITKPDARQPPPSECTK